MKLLHGDCLDVMEKLINEGVKVDAVVTDPPYGLSFMGKAWDASVPSKEVWEKVLKLLKPGGHLLCFAGTRTHHRMACAIEDAGLELRDTIMWVYGSGFPKNHNISKAIDKIAGAEREIVGLSNRHGGGITGNGTSFELPPKKHFETAPATEGAKQWDGWGTALKPAYEPVVVARMPIAEKNIAKNVLKYGTGAINIDGARVGSGGGTRKAPSAEKCITDSVGGFLNAKAGLPVDGMGRFPANLIHDGSDELVSLLGDATRFFYCAKASKKDRDEGLEGLQERQYSHDGRKTPIDNAYQRNSNKARNHHPTVKPTKLMRYLCRLVTPPGGTVLDPFMGSGSTGKACVLEGFSFIGIELDEEYLKIAKARIEAIERMIGKEAG